MIRTASFLAALCLLMLLPSCGQDDGRVPVFPVQGLVLHEGQPAAGALVIFNPVDSDGQATLVPSGTVDADGSLRLTSYESGDGAPVGKYRVTVRWPEPPKSPLEPPDMGADRLGSRFISPERSPWEVEVTEGENLLSPFHLDRVEPRGGQ